MSGEPKIGPVPDKVSGPAEPTRSNVLPEIAGRSTAPFIYFDRVSSFGVEGNTIILELVARTLVAREIGSPINEIVATAHLRCDLAGAQSLQAALNQIGLLIAPPGTEAKN